MAPHRSALLGPSICLAFAVLSIAACSSDRRPDARLEKEQTAAVAQKVRLADFTGSSLAAKQIALTFDDGPGSRTLELSAFLKAEGIRATFFSNGHCFGNDNPCGNPNLTPAQVYGQLVADGHLVANHTQDHVDLTQFPATPAGDANLLAQVVSTDTLIAPYVPNNHFLLRPPYGYWNNRDYTTIHANAMDKYVGPIRWDIGGQMTGTDATGFAADWDCWQNTSGFGAKTGTQCAARYMNEITAVGKGISLMHDSDSSPNINNHDVNVGTGNTIDMVKLILVPALKAAGWTFVRVDDVPDISAALPPPPCDASCTTCSGPAANQCTGCPDGKYLSGGSCVSCNAACVTCSGAGANACTSCAGGKYLAGGACNACSACGPTQYEAAACTGTTNTVCNACDASCGSCNGAGANACTSCKGSTWLNGSTCSACTVCGAATYPATACTSNADTVCAACDASCGNVCSGPNSDQCGACAPNMYLNAGMCHACATCAAGTARTVACTPTANTACAACAPGKFSAEAGATSCTACAAGTFSASAGAKTCTPCAAGTFSAAGASACTPCAAGTFAAAGATVCTACAPGTHSAASATSCSACGSCNDNDDCTTDTCDGAKGCTHTAVAGCVPKGGTGTVDPPEATDPPAETSDDSGCNVGHGSRSSGLFMMAFGTLAMLVWRRQRVGRSFLS